jgi:hypothetical protein
VLAVIPTSRRAIDIDGARKKNQTAHRRAESLRTLCPWGRDRGIEARVRESNARIGGRNRHAKNEE